MPPVGNAIEMIEERTKSVAADFKAARTVEAYRRAQIRAGDLPIAAQYEVVDDAIACHRRVLPRAAN